MAHATMKPTCGRLTEPVRLALAGAVLHHIIELRSAKASRGGQQVDRLQDARLALAIVAGDHIDPPRRLDGHALEIAKIGDRQAVESERIDQIRIGMTTAM